ncbi:GL26442 [Drosophila persimilis]|uniref:GL26442 n=1 Tax=Drosophila persimilis TaxID=7234 RepID=B4GSQ5_DROPE|nr:GL26442 [Drosophila persimilis]
MVNGTKVEQKTPSNAGSVVEDAPHGYAFSEDAPNEDGPNEDAPSEDAPNEDAPNEDALWEYAPNEDALWEYAPNEDAPNEDAPSEDAPNEDALWEYAPNEDAPWEYAPSEDAPWEYAPSEDAPAPTSSLFSFCAFPPTENTGKPKMPVGCRPIQAHTPSFAPSSVFGAITAAPSSNRYSAVYEVNQPFATNTAAVILREVGATALLKRVGRPEPLTPNLRRIAINTIADYFVKKEFPLSISKSRNLDRELLSLFPGDQESDYKVSDRSRMYVRYNNRKRLEKHHANVRRKLIWTPTTNEPFSPETSVASWSQTLPVEFDDVPDNTE